MSFKSTLHQLRWLEENVPPSLIDIFAKALKGLLVGQSDVATSLNEAVLWHVLYVCIRHKKWLSSPLFCDCLVDLLSGTYGFPHELGEHCVKRLKVLVIEICGDEKAAPLTDQDFLTLIMAEVIKTGNKEQCLEHIGCGKNIIEMAFQVVARATAGQMTYYMTQSSESLLADIWQEWAAHKQVIPWIVDHYLLFYDLFPLSMTHIDHTLFGSQVFPFLMSLFTKDSFHLDQGVLKLLPRLFAKGYIVGDETHINLHHLNLTDKGEAMTALYFCANRKQIPITRISFHWQRAYVAGLTHVNELLEVWNEFEQDKKPYHRDRVELLILQRLYALEYDAHTLSEGFLQRVLKDVKSSHVGMLKRERCQVLRLFAESIATKAQKELVDRLFRDVLSDHRTQVMKNTIMDYFYASIGTEHLPISSGLS